eukprot:sb/3469596/
MFVTQRSFDGDFVRRKKFYHVIPSTATPDPQLPTIMGSFFMGFKFFRKLTYPLQLKHLCHSIKHSDIHWYDVVDEVVVLGAIPLKHKDFTWTTNLNIKGVISLNEPYETKRSLTVEEWSSNHGVENLKFNVADHVGAATLEEVQEVLAFITRISTTHPGSKVYIHCKAGKGRSASVVMCYLISKNPGMTPEQSFDALREKRSQISLGAKQWQLLNQLLIELLTNWS